MPGFLRREAEGGVCVSTGAAVAMESAEVSKIEESGPETTVISNAVSSERITGSADRLSVMARCSSGEVGSAAAESLTRSTTGRADTLLGTAQRTPTTRDTTIVGRGDRFPRIE